MINIFNISAWQQPEDLPFRAFPLFCRVHTCSPVPSDQIWKRWVLIAKCRGVGEPAVPEDGAVVGVGQLEVLGSSRRGEADHLNTSHVRALHCILHYMEYLLKEKKLAWAPCQGRWYRMAMDWTKLEGWEGELRRWCRWGRRRTRPWWRAWPACSCSWLPGMTGPGWKWRRQVWNSRNQLESQCASLRSNYRSKAATHWHWFTYCEHCKCKSAFPLSLISFV